MIKSLYDGCQRKLLLVVGSSIVELFHTISLLLLDADYSHPLKCSFRFKIAIFMVNVIRYPLFESISCFFVILNFTLAIFNGWLFEPVQFIWSNWKPESWEMLNKLFTSSRFVNIDSNSKSYWCSDTSWSCCLYDTMTQTKLFLTWWNQQRRNVFQQFRNQLLSICNIPYHICLRSFC